MVAKSGKAYGLKLIGELQVANPIAEYSTLNPATSSASASGKSNGALSVSAKAEKAEPVPLCLDINSMVARLGISICAAATNNSSILNSVMSEHCADMMLSTGNKMYSLTSTVRSCISTPIGTLGDFLGFIMEQQPASLQQQLTEFHVCALHQVPPAVVPKGKFLHSVTLCIDGVRQSIIDALGCTLVNMLMCSRRA